MIRFSHQSFVTMRWCRESRSVKGIQRTDRSVNGASESWNCWGAIGVEGGRRGQHVHGAGASGIRSRLTRQARFFSILPARNMDFRRVK
jgi:hypothetical protein